MSDLELIKQQAKKELDEEKFRASVEKEKERLKNKKRFWELLPFRIRIEKVSR